jgi:hypothetical protein
MTIGIVRKDKCCSPNKQLQKKREKINNDQLYVVKFKVIPVAIGTLNTLNNLQTLTGKKKPGSMNQALRVLPTVIISFYPVSAVLSFSF